MKWLREKIQKKMAMVAAVLLSVLLVNTNCLAPAAAETASLDFSRTGSIKVVLATEDGSFATDGAITIYQVATLYLNDGDMAYALTEGFQYFEGELNVNVASLASELAEYVKVHLEENEDDIIIEGTEQNIGTDGTVVFEELELGLYLVMQTVPSTGYYSIEPFVVTVPLEDDGEWEYEVDASPKTELEPAPETEPQSEPQTETESEPQSEPQTETESERQTETEPQSEPQTETEPESEIETETESETESEPETGVETETESEPETEVETETESEPETEVETETETETDTEIETESETEPQTQTETDQTEPPTQTETESETESETEPKLPQTGQLNWPIPMLAAGGLVLIALGILLARPKNKGNK